MTRQISKYCALLGISTILCGVAQAASWPVTEFAPRTYQCVRAYSAPVIDGAGDDPAWQNAEWTESFVDISGSELLAPPLLTRVRMLWNEDALFVFAEIDDPAINATLTERDSVIFHDNDFEVFIDPDSDNHSYAELEINALGTIWDLLLNKPYRDGGMALSGWDIKGLESAVAINGTLNDASDTDTGWNVELAIPWNAFAEFANCQVPPAPGDRWRMNFSRVQYAGQISEGSYSRKTAADGSELSPDNWVWSPQGVVDMHCPEMWGVVEFAGGIVMPQTPELQAEDYARQALMCLYYWQKDYHAEHGQFSATKIYHWYDNYELPEVDSFRSWLLQDEMWASRDYFRFSMSNGVNTISIDESGRISRTSGPLSAISSESSQHATVPEETPVEVTEVEPEPDPVAPEPAEVPDGNERPNPNGRPLPANPLS